MKRIKEVVASKIRDSNPEEATGMAETIKDIRIKGTSAKDQIQDQEIVARSLREKSHLRKERLRDLRGSLPVLLDSAAVVINSVKRAMLLLKRKALLS